MRPLRFLFFTANLLLPLLTSLAFEHRFSLPFGEGGAALRRTVTDEGSPLTADLNAARTFVILWLAAGAASAPSEEGAVAVKMD